MTRRSVAGAAVAGLLTALAACGDDATMAEAQLAARINDGAISVQQVRAVLTHQPRLLAELPDTATIRVLDALVDQELAAQAAVEQGLDRDPATRQAVALATREVLARAFQDRIATPATDPGDAEIDRYYNAHPLLFARRRLYTIQEFAVEAPPAQAATLASIARRALGAEEVGALLQEAGLSHRSRRFVDAAEDVPALLLEPLSKLERGQSVVAPGPVPRIFTVLEVQAAPVGREEARDAIAGHLAGERRRQLVVPALRALRQRAQIRYQGGFAKSPSQQRAAAAGAI